MRGLGWAAYAEQQKLTFTDWGPGEPNNAGDFFESEDCIAFSLHRWWVKKDGNFRENGIINKWNDAKCSEKKVCTKGIDSSYYIYKSKLNFSRYN